MSLDIEFLKKYIPPMELQTIISYLDDETGPHFRKLLKKTEEKIKAVPSLYSGEEQGLKARVHLHYYVGGTDFYVSEMDQETGETFGFACINGDRENAELGYNNISEIISIPWIELDLYFDNSVTLGEIVKKYKPYCQSSETENEDETITPCQ